MNVTLARNLAVTGKRKVQCEHQHYAVRAGFERRWCFVLILLSLLILGVFTYLRERAGRGRKITDVGDITGKEDLKSHIHGDTRKAATEHSGVIAIPQ